MDKINHISINELTLLSDSVNHNNVILTPIPGFCVQNINMPDCYKKVHELPKTILSDVRLFFNTLTLSNIDASQQNLHKLLHNDLPIEAANKKISNLDLFTQVVKEILELFLVDPKNVHMFYTLLSKISNISINNDFKSSIKYVFLQECREQFNNLINNLNIRHLASQDDSSNGLDIYTRGFDKISNLLLLFSELYSMRNKPVLNIKSNLMMLVVSALIDNYLYSYGEYDYFCKNNDLDEIDDVLYNEYDILKKIKCIYASQLCYIFDLQASSFLVDNIESNNVSLKKLSDRFNNEVVVTITEKYLISKINEIKWK